MTKRLHNFDILTAWYKEHLTINHYRPRTIADYLFELSLFRRWLAKESTVQDLDDLSKEDLTTYLTELYRKNLEIGTISHKIAVLKSFFNILYKENKIYHNLSGVLNAPKRTHTVPAGIPTEQEIAILLNYLEETTKETKKKRDLIRFRTRVIVELFYSTGVRQGELLPATVDSLDLANGLFYIRNGKGGKDRVVPVGSVASDLCEIYLSEIRPELITDTSESYLFPSSRGGHISSKAAGYALKQLCAIVGITKKIRLHDLRHACATHMINNGADIRYVQELLGHSSLSSTQIYTHIAVDHLKKSHAKYHPREQWEL